MKQNSHSYNLNVLTSGAGLGKIFGTPKQYASYHHSLRLTAGKPFNKYSSIPNFTNPLNLGSPPSPKEVRQLMVLHEQGHIPDSFDWRNESKKLNIKMEDVKNQQHCGCCWAMASASTLSDRFNISNKKGDKTPDLSPLQLAGCIADNEGRNCHGGNLNFSTQYMLDHGLISNEVANFESTCTNPDSCTESTIFPCKQDWENAIKYKITEARTIRGNKSNNPINTFVGTQAYGNKLGHLKVTFDRDPISVQNQMKAQIYSHGPLITSFYVYTDFQGEYPWSSTNNIYIHEAYGSTQWAGGHAVEIVGWGIDRNVPKFGEIEYWIVKNSWGPEWGDGGYCKFAMTQYNSQEGRNILSTTINGFTGIDVPFIQGGVQPFGGSWYVYPDNKKSGGNHGNRNPHSPGGGGTAPPPNKKHNDGGGYENGQETDDNKKWIQKYWWIILIAVLIVGILIIILAARA